LATHAISCTKAERAYGKVLAQQEAIAQPFKYAGQVGIMDEGNDLYYMRARYYDASIGRFISEDPVGFADGPNLYAYVGGNPIMAVDPSGQVNVRNLAFSLVDFGLSTGEATVGLVGIAGAPVTGPAAPVVLMGAALATAHATMGMTNAVIDMRNALYETDNGGVFETLGETIAGENGATIGKAADLFTGLRPGAAAAGGMNTLKDAYDVTSGVNSMRKEFGPKPNKKVH